MESIYDPATLQHLLQRINILTPVSQAIWGKMNVSQMLAHCCAPLAVSVGDITPRPNFLVKLLGSLVKSSVVSEKPFKHGLPTDKSFIIADTRDFNKEKQRLVSLLTRMSQAGPDAMNGRAHPFFGKLTPDEWSVLTVKHMDHHLRQFGA